MDENGVYNSLEQLKKNPKGMRELIWGKYIILKHEIIDTYNLKDDKNTDVEEIIERFFIGYLNQFSGFMEEIILRHYYKSFLVEIKPQIEALLAKRKTLDPEVTNIFSFDLLEERKEIEKANSMIIQDAISSYCFEIKSGFALNALNHDKISLEGELGEILENKNLFEKKKNIIPGLTARHIEYEFNYSEDQWQEIFKKCQARINEIETNFPIKMRDINRYYESSILENFDKCLSLYKEFINIKMHLDAMDEYIENEKGRQL